MAANERDVLAATALSAPLRSRLSLSPHKLASLAEGLRQLAGVFCLGRLCWHNTRLYFCASMNIHCA